MSIVIRRITILIGIVLLIIRGCAIAPIDPLMDGTSLVAKKSDIDNAATPKGFKISPAQALFKITKGSPQKYGWRIYADHKNYYLVQEVPLFIITSAYARMYGIRINGKTGKTAEIMEEYDSELPATPIE